MESVEEFVESWKNWKLVNAIIHGIDNRRKSYIKESSRRTIVLLNGYEFVADFFLHPPEGATRIQFFEQIGNVEELYPKGEYELLEIERIE